MLISISVINSLSTILSFIHSLLVNELLTSFWNSVFLNIFFLFYWSYHETMTMQKIIINIFYKIFYYFMRLHDFFCVSFSAWLFHTIKSLVIVLSDFVILIFESLMQLLSSFLSPLKERPWLINEKCDWFQSLNFQVTKIRLSYFLSLMFV